MCEAKIESWINLVLENEEFTNYKFVELLKNHVEIGMYRNMFFVTVKLLNQNQEEKVFDFVIKASQEDEKLRENKIVTITFCKEIFLYDKVHKAFVNFQNEMTTKKLLDFLPRCYATQVTKTSEVLVFENLTSLGFRLWDKTKAMDFEHLKLVMEAFGKWHAFSFAVKDKQNEVFQKLIKDNINSLNLFFVDSKMDEVVYEVYEEARNELISSTDDLENKSYFSKEEAFRNFGDLYFDDLDYSVILHGDCFTENFMFAYDENQKVDRLQIIDWQSSGLASPVMDLSYFFYSCCDTEQYKDISVFLQIYHNSLSYCLKSLGCDPDKLFPYSKLQEHWVRFSRWGILLQALVLKFAFCQKQEVPNFGEAAKKEITFADISRNLKVGDKNEYSRRVKNNLLHYINNLKIYKKI